MGAAITARFINKDKPVTSQDVKNILKKLGTTVSKQKTVTFPSANKNKDIIDEVCFHVSLAESNMKFLVDQTKWNDISDLIDSSIAYANRKNSKRVGFITL